MTARSQSGVLSSNEQDFTLANQIADAAVQWVCELPDYTSPDDQPDLLQCKPWELHACVVNAIEQIAPKLTEHAPETPAPLPSPYSALTHGSLDVLIERTRQVTGEGWTPEHDDSHASGELAQAAACYALRAGGIHLNQAHDLWPWSDSWWKPKNDRRDLVRAAALIIAEIDRLDRKAPPANGSEQS